MFTAVQFKERLNEIPFRPFRIHMAGGSTDDVTHHDGAIVKRHGLETGPDPDADGIAGKFVMCAMVHISRIEDRSVQAA